MIVATWNISWFTNIKQLDEKVKLDSLEYVARAHSYELKVLRGKILRLELF